MCKKYAKILMKIVAKQQFLHFANFATISQKKNLDAKAECTIFASKINIIIIYNMCQPNLSSETHFSDEELEYIKMLNDHVIRMDECSKHCKELCVTLFTAMLSGDILFGQGPSFLIVLGALVIVVSMFFLDGYYHSINRCYRDLEIQFLDMNSQDRRSRLFRFKLSNDEQKEARMKHNYREALLSKATYLLYSGLILGVIAYFIAFLFSK